MSRSIKKHFGGKIAGSSDKKDGQSWHRSARREVNVQLKNVETSQNFDEFIFWKKKQEVSDVWGFASDGGSYWQYNDFEHFYQDRIFWYQMRSYRKNNPIPTREEVWIKWIKYIRK